MHQLQIFKNENFGEIRTLEINDVIGDDKKLIEGYISIIKEMPIKYGAKIA